MIPLVLLGLVVGLPLFLGLIWRVNTSYLFFSMLAGELLARYFGDDAELVIRAVTRNESFVAYAHLIVLVLPVVVTAIFLRKTLSKGKVLIHVLPFLITGFVFAAFALPLLPPSVQEQIRTTHAGQRILEGNEVIVGAVVFLQLVTLWVTNRPHEKHGKH